MDVATLLTGAGGIAAASKVPWIAKAGKVAGQVANLGDPVSLAGKLPLVPVMAAGGKLSKKLYQSALKPSTRMPLEKQLQIVETGIKEGVVINESGLAKLRGKIDQTNDAIDAAINTAQAQGKTVDMGEVIKRLDEVRPAFENTLLSDDYVKLFDNHVDEFVKKYSIYTQQPGERPVPVTWQAVPIQEAQELKRKTYTLLKKSFGEQKAATVEAKKALARGVKEEIAKVYPEISALNKKDSALLALEAAIEPAVSRALNSNLVGLGDIAAAAVGGVSGGVGVTAAQRTLEFGLVKRIIDAPMLKSKAAIAVDKARKLKPPFLPRQLLYQGVRGTGSQ